MKRILGILVIFTILFIGCTQETQIEPKELPKVEDIEPEQEPIEEESIIEPIEPEEPVEDFITLEELSTHDLEEDCWIGFEGNVYDISDYIGKHPGGKKGITNLCGTSEEFEDAFAQKHGNSKVDILLQESDFKGELE